MSEVLRTRVALTAEAAAGRLDEDAPSCALYRLGQTTTKGAYPAAANAFYAVTRLSLLGTEAEGSPGVPGPTAEVFLALNVGSAVPPPGQEVLCCWVDSRWAFRHDG